MLICDSCGRENEPSFRFCPACGAELALEASEERRRLVTVLFCDVQGSTAMGERLDAESVREIMQHYFHEMRSAIEHHGGTVEKFVGDAIMAVFGIPQAHEDDPLRAVRAAWEMQRRVPSMNERLDHRFGSRLSLRIGVNTGEVVTGEATAREAIVTGDAVNVAARLEQAVEPGEVLLGEQTYQLVRDAVSVALAQPLTLKGKSQPVAAYRLLAVEDRALGRRRAFDTPIVGREEQLETLREAFEQAIVLERAVLAIVVGMPGVGKSRLAREFVERIDATTAAGRCLSYGEGITYWPLAEAVRQAAGILEHDSAAGARQKIAGLARGEDRGALIAERVAQALGLAGGTAPAEEIRWAFRRLFLALARHRPVVLLIDDLQWAEPSLVDFLEELAVTDEGPLLVLGLGRPELLEARSSWSESALHLEPLAGAAARLLVEELATAADLPEELRARVFAASGGNPLFIEELLALVQQDPDAEFPPTLDLLLSEHLERLSSDERRAAERGSVEGEVFHRGAVVELSEPRTRAKVGPALQYLADRELVLPAEALFANEAAFAFRHILIRDAAYRGMLKKLRARLHERFARWLERVAEDRVGEYEEILGYHLEQAFRYRQELGTVERYRELADRAADWLGRAGARAARLGNAGAAVKLLQRAVALLPDDATSRPDLLLTLGEAHWSQFQPAVAVETLSAAAETAASAGRTDIEACSRLALGLIGTHMNREGGEAESRRTAEEWLPVLEELGDDRGLAKAYLALGTYEWASLKSELASTYLERALAHARSAGSTQDELLATFWLALIAVAGPEPVDQAIERLERLADGAATLATEATILERIGTLHAVAGRFGKGRALVVEAEATYEELGLGYPLGYLRWFTLGRLAELEGDYDETERIFRSGCAALQAAGEASALSTLLGELSIVLSEQGRYEEAEKLTLQNEALGDPDDQITQCLWRIGRARAIVRRDPAAAERLAREALGMAGDLVSGRAGSRAALAEAMAASGQQAEAAHLGREVVGIYEAKGNRPLAERARARLEQLLAAG